MTILPVGRPAGPIVNTLLRPAMSDVVVFGCIFAGLAPGSSNQYLLAASNASILDGVLPTYLFWVKHSTLTRIAPRRPPHRAMVNPNTPRRVRRYENLHHSSLVQHSRHYQRRAAVSLPAAQSKAARHEGCRRRTCGVGRRPTSDARAGSERRTIRLECRTALTRGGRKKD